MIRAYYTSKLVPTGDGSGNFSVDLWENVRRSRFVVETMEQSFDPKLLVFAPHRHEMLIRLWERDELSSGEIAMFNTQIINLCDILIVDSDPSDSSEVTMDVQFAIDNRLDVCYTYQHTNLDDKFKQLDEVIRNFKDESNKI